MQRLLTKLAGPIGVRLIFGCLSIIALLHFWTINRYALNIPIGDDWEILGNVDYLGRWNIQWILAQHNEHRMVLTKIQIWLLYEWNNWDIRTQIAQNFLIYLSVVGAFALALRTISNRILPVVLLSSVFLLSTRVSENHAWAFQSAFHWVLLFGILTCILLFKEKINGLNVFGASICSVLALYSFSSGAAMIAAVTIMFSIYIVFRRVKLKKNPSEIVMLLGFLTIVAVAGWMYFTTGQLSIAGHPKYSFPHELMFWHYFLHLISNGFGVVGESIVPGIIFLAVSLLPILILGIRQVFSRNLDTPFWILVGLFVMVFSILATITIGRAGFGYLQARASRYVEFTDLLIPLTICSWFYLLSFNKWAQNVITAALFVVFFYCYRTSWDFDSTYRSIAKLRKTGIHCLEKGLKESEPLTCPELYPGDMRGRFEVARQLKVSFTSSIEAKLSSTDISLKEK